MEQRHQPTTQMLLVGLWALLLVVCTSSVASAQEGDVKNPDDHHTFLQVEGFISALSDASDRSALATALGYGVQGGYRWNNWGVFGKIEQDRWRANELSVERTDGVLNVGGGMDYRFFDNQVRSSLAVGTSTLLFDTLLDDKGTTGYFIDLRPGGIRWFPTDWLVLELQPFTFAWMQPVLFDTPLIQIEYRTLFAMEFVL